MTITLEHKDTNIVDLFTNYNYKNWQETRVNKIVNLFGPKFFLNVSILELGAGLGHMGLRLMDMGATVTFAEGKQDNYELMRLHVYLNKGRDAANKCILLNQETKWSFVEKFDAIIHWGVSYHLDNWVQDLTCAAEHTDLIFFETMVVDSDDPEYEIKLVEHPGIDQAVSNGHIGMTGTRPSPAKVEKTFVDLGFSFIRYDDRDINQDSYHRYDWISRNDKSYIEGNRRFWVAKRNK